MCEFKYMLFEFKAILCIGSNSCCFSSNICCVCIKFILCLESNSSCVWAQSHVVMLCVNATLCSIWVQHLSHIWITILVAFELKFLLCLNIIVYCIIQWMYVIVHLVRMEERAQYLDVVTRVPVGMDFLGISVKVHLIFI